MTALSKGASRKYRISILLMGVLLISGGQAFAQQRAKFQTHHPNHDVVAISFSPDGKKFASVGHDQVVKVWDSKTQECLLTFSFDIQHYIRFVEILPAGDVAVVARQRTKPEVAGWDVWLCDLKIGSKDKHFSSGSDFLQGLWGDRNTVIVSAKDAKEWDKSHFLKFVDLGGKKATSVRFSQPRRVLAFSVDRKQVLLDAGTHKVGILDIATGKLLAAVDTPEVNQRTSCRLTPDNKTLITAHALGGNTCDVHFWDVATGQRKSTHVASGHFVEFLGDFSPDGKLLPVLTHREVNFFHLEKQKFIAVRKVTEDEWITCFRFAPDGRSYAIGTREGTIEVFATPDKEDKAPPDPKTVVAAVLKFQTAKDPELKAQALEDLVKLVPKGPGMVTLLVNISKGNEPERVRLASVTILGTLGRDAKEAVPALIEALKARDGADAVFESRFKVAVIMALGEIGPAAKEALPILEELASSPDQAIRSQVSAALNKIQGSH